MSPPLTSLAHTSVLYTCLIFFNTVQQAAAGGALATADKAGITVPDLGGAAGAGGAFVADPAAAGAATGAAAAGGAWTTSADVGTISTVAPTSGDVNFEMETILAEKPSDTSSSVKKEGRIKGFLTRLRSFKPGEPPRSFKSADTTGETSFSNVSGSGSQQRVVHVPYIL